MDAPFNLTMGFWNPKPLRNRNRRFACKACPAKTTKRQLKINGGLCQACKAPIAAAQPQSNGE